MKPKRKPIPQPQKESEKRTIAQGRQNGKNDDPHRIIADGLPMNRKQRRDELRRIQKLPPDQFQEMLNLFHTRAYAAAQDHYHTALEATLQPRFVLAVKEKAKEIRELWDGVETVTTSATTAAFYNTLTEGDEGLGEYVKAGYNVPEARALRSIAERNNLDADTILDALRGPFPDRRLQL